MKNVVILGAGTAGTIVANRLSKRLPDGWRVTLIEPEAGHLYQPGLLFLPFGARDERKMVRPRKRTLFGGVRWIEKRAEKIDPDRRPHRSRRDPRADRPRVGPHRPRLLHARRGAGAP